MVFFWCQVVTEENKSGPLIVLLKDVEKSFTGITESLSSLRNKLEPLPPGILIIGSHTQMDSRKEKVHTRFRKKIPKKNAEGLNFLWYCGIMHPYVVTDQNQIRLQFLWVLIMTLLVSLYIAEL
jgi:hypothetical protein